MPFQVGHVSFNESRVLRQLRQDLKDDWFPDPLLFKDMIEGQELCLLEQITANVEHNHGRYAATPRSIYNLPKPNFTLRYALEVGLADRALYHALVAYLVPLYDKLLLWNAFSHRPIQSSNAKRMFKRGVSAWKDFVGSVRNALVPGTFLVTADISNYFENIDLKQLRSTLESLIPALDADTQTKSRIWSQLELLFECLTTWAFVPHRGLPQNRDASSFLANIYLHPVDVKMCEHGYSDRYFRYMDDIRIVCHDAYEARHALKQLSIALRDVGLALNAKKTDIFEATATDQIDKYLNDVSSEVQHLDILWNTRNREVILRTAAKVKDLTIRLIKASKTESRDFRFCILRLEDLALCDELFVPEEFYKDITPAILRGLIDVPSSTDYFARYLLAVPVSPADLELVSDYVMDKRRAIYSWQNYRLWCLLAQKRFMQTNLLRRAITVIGKEDDNPTRGGASIYAGSLGGVSERQIVAQRFQSLTSFIGQRSALLATHELAYKPYVESYIKPYVRADLIGVYKRLRARRGQYFSPIEKRPISRFVGREREYD
jgi:hypothetical protein